jgi:hypothetical protein
MQSATSSRLARPAFVVLLIAAMTIIGQPSVKGRR